MTSVAFALVDVILATMNPTSSDLRVFAVLFCVIDQSFDVVLGVGVGAGVGVGVGVGVEVNTQFYAVQIMYTASTLQE